MANNAEIIELEELEVVPNAAEILPRILDLVGLLLEDYVRFSSKSQAVAVALWLAQAAARGEDHEPIWDAYVRLLVTSHENGSGKSTVADMARILLNCRCGRPGKMTPAGLTCIFGKYHETAILDDAQNTFNTDGAGVSLQTIIINGYKPGATWVTGYKSGTVDQASGQMLVVGKDELITKRADALADMLVRSIIVRLERTPEFMPQLGRASRSELERVGKSLRAVMCSLRNELLVANDTLATQLVGSAVTDMNGARTAEIWRPLHAVAWVAGGSWPEAATRAQEELANGGEDLMAAADVIGRKQGRNFLR